MPKLKVPGENLKTKDRRGDPQRLCRKRKPSKEHGTDAIVIDSNPKVNGTTFQTAFHGMYGESGDEVILKTKINC